MTAPNEDEVRPRLYRLSELVDAEELQRLAELLYGAVGFPVGILDPDGAVLVAAGWQDICLHFHRAHPETAARCRESDAYIQSHLSPAGGFVEYKCRNGLRDMAVPIMIGDQHIGTMFLGQFLYEGEEPDVECFRRQAREFGFDEPAYLAALSRLPVFSREKVQRIMSYNIGLVHLLARKGMTRLQQLETERALRESEENLRITLDSIADGVIATDVAGRIAGMNPVAVRLTGVSSEAAEGRPLREVCPLEDIETGTESPDLVGVLMRDGTLDGHPEGLISSAADGTRRRVEVTGNPIRDREGRKVGAVLVFRDVTEQSALEEQLRQSQKLEALGQLAGGVAHDFNNLLAAIHGSAELLGGKLARRPEEAGLVERILMASERAAQLTRKLLAFSRKRKLSRAFVDVHDLVGEVAELLRRSIDRSIVLETRLAAERPFVHGDATQIQSALLNLGLNARDAMPQGGQLVIRTRDVKVAKGRRDDAPPELPAGRYLELTVTDTGEGIRPEVQQRIFEPFFTTKPPGKGTGLGLAGVVSCVQGHAGAVQVRSAPGRGSTFRVLLPALPAAPAQPKAPRRPPEVAPVERGHVLVVDDEEVVRSVTALALQRLGYRVTTCADGAEAVSVFRRQHADIAAVVLDLVMPNMGGAETFHALRAIDPGVRVLLSSGFGRSAAVEALEREGVRGVLPKPFRLEELAEAMRAL